MDNTPKHTPGPWHIERWTYDNRKTKVHVCSKEQAIARIHKLYPENSTQSEANAVLLAAAPTMLETLKSIAMIASCAPNDDPERADEQFEKIMNMANRAVKTAMGE